MVERSIALHDRRPARLMVDLRQPPRLLDQHHRHSVADRIGEPRGIGDQLLRCLIVTQELARGGAAEL